MGSKKTVFIACGGTGGHLTPGISAGECVNKVIPEAEVLYILSGKEIEKNFIKEQNLNYYPVNFNKFGFLKGILKYPFVFFKMLFLFIRKKPSLVLGFGSITGFFSGLCSKLFGVPLIIFEQNTIMGKANRLGRIFADKVMLSFPLHNRELRQRDVVVGNLIRESVKKRAKLSKEKAREILGLEEKFFTVMVSGGSQGALSLNRFMIAFAGELAKAIPNLQIIHITGKHLKREVEDKYCSLNIRCFVRSFHSDMGLLYCASDVVLARAGSTTMFELAYFKKPCVFVPYPYAADNHQYFNALYVVEKGGGILIEDKALLTDDGFNKFLGFIKDKEKMKLSAENLSSSLKIAECEQLSEYFRELVR